MKQVLSILKDSQNQILYKEQGYVVLEIKDISIVKDLRDIILQRRMSFGNDFFYSMLGLSKDESLEIKSQFSAILQKVYDEFFENYINRNESFLVKPASLNQEMALHQDWSFTDSEHQMGTFWLPLEEVNKENGCMLILPKSQDFGNPFVSNTYQTSRIPSKNLFAAIPIPLKEGELLFFNPSVFHGSFPNNSSKNRIVVTSQIFDKKAPYLYYHKKDSNSAQVLQLEENDLYFRMRELIDGNITNFALWKEIEYSHREIFEEELNKLC